MTDNDWIKQLQSMMERHEQAAPDGLWQDIEARLPEHRAPRRPSVAWRCIAAAAAASLVIIGGYLLWPETEKTVNQPAITSATVQDEPVNDLITPEMAGDGPSRSHTVIPDAHAPHHYSVHSVKPATQQPTLEEKAKSLPQQAATDTPDEKRQEVIEQPQRPMPPASKDEPLLASSKPNHDIGEAPVKSLRQRHRPVTMGLYASNGISNDGIGSQPIAFASDALYKYYKAPKQPNTYFADDIYQAHHHAPYSIGLSVKLPLDDRWALTSGVVYTRVKSDYTSPSSTRVQTLHYMGVPVGLTFKIWDHKRLRTYAIGGVQADFNVKATLTQNGKADKMSIDKDRVQFSAMLGPGVQLDLSRGIGIYCEPTVRYYIDNRSDIQNYFKHKPLNVNINAGLRLTLQ